MITINDKKDCSGCYSCASICPKQCITMEPDSEGFWYPVVDTNACISCEKCVHVCPVINHTPLQHEPTAYACYNKNEKTRYRSSSGGIFTILAKQIIKEKGVVFGACYDKSMHVIHGYSDTMDGLKKFRGSKYVQSKIGNSYAQAKDFLVQGRTVLFSGTPCQISGLKSYLGKPYEKLFCIDLICHGVPSPKVFEKYIARQEAITERTISRIAFRNKKLGWRHACVLTEYTDGSITLKKSAANLYMKLYRMNIMLRPSCYSCVHKQAARTSDITLADFWGVWHVLPDMNDDKGTSLILLQSENGRKLFDLIKKNMVYQEIPASEAIKHNRSAIRSTTQHPSHDLFFQNLDEMPLRELTRLCIKQATLNSVEEDNDEEINLEADSDLDFDSTTDIEIDNKED